MTTEEIILNIHDLRVEFITSDSLTTAVNQVSFTLKRGEVLGIVGESGSGKSVTALAILGLLPPKGKVTKGTIEFTSQDNQGNLLKPIDLLGLKPAELTRYRGNQIGMIFQEPMSSLNPVFTIGSQIIETITQHQKVSITEAKQQAVSLLQEVKLLPPDHILSQEYLELTHTGSKDIQPDEIAVNQYIHDQKMAMLDRYPHQLSGGQLQRVMIAIAICCNPVLLIADEPTTALDVTVQATILDLLKELCDRRKMSIIFISHDLGIIAKIADQVAVMYRGEIRELGLVKNIFTEPKHPYTKGLLACRPPLDRQVDFLPTINDFMEVEEGISQSLIIKEKTPIITDESIPCLAKQFPHEYQQQPLLEVQDLRVGFPKLGIFGNQGYFWAVDNISFNVFQGETLGLVGESGCGKSTLARTLLRLIEPHTGIILFEGENISDLSGKSLQILRRSMQIVFQNPFSSLNPRMKVGDIVMEPLKIHRTGGNKKQQQERAIYLLEKVGLTANAMNRYPHEFSGGQRQRICIARSLSLNPKFIICDESVSALDVSVQAEVLNLLKSLQKEFELTYIFISHDLSVVRFMSDRIMVMNKGKIEEIGLANQIYRSPETAYTKQLISSIPDGLVKINRHSM